MSLRGWIVRNASWSDLTVSFDDFCGQGNSEFLILKTLDAQGFQAMTFETESIAVPV
jgi:hypothetical protein